MATFRPTRPISKGSPKTGPYGRSGSTLSRMLLFAGGTVLTLVLVDFIDFLNRPRQGA